MTRQEVDQAIDALAQGLGHARWSGKTFREFWAWFNAEADRIERLAPPDELDAVRDRLLDLRDSAHDGYGVPEARADDVIDPPM